VPISIVGKAPAIENHGGILTQNMDEVEIECFPSDLVASVEINVDGLTELNDSLFVSDLIVPETLTILSDMDSMVVKIEPPRTLESLEALDEELDTSTGAEPEVISEAREDEEGEAAAEEE
jgi:large subunit ribosomal protein L25